MAQKAHVPKFGNWEADDNVPYTQYFDKARMGISGVKILNPNDPDENPDVFGDASPIRVRPVKQKNASKTRNGNQRSREVGHHGQPHSGHDYGVRKATATSPPQRSYGDLKSSDRQQRSHEANGRTDRSRKAPHPQHQAHTRKKYGDSSPSWERMVRSEGSNGFSLKSPNRSKMKPVGRNNEAINSNDKSSQVPRFGEWDETDPASADGFTHMFNKVREEKQNAAAKVPVITHEPANAAGGKRGSSTTGGKRAGKSKGTICGCFGQGKK